MTLFFGAQDKYLFVKILRNRQNSNNFISFYILIIYGNIIYFANLTIFKNFY